MLLEATAMHSNAFRTKTASISQTTHIIHRHRLVTGSRYLIRKTVVALKGDAVGDALGQLTAEQIEQFRKYFNMFDKENKGYIRATQVGQILRTMGQAFEERDLKQLIKEFDTDGSGEIEFEEFAAMVANFVVNSEDNEGLEEELREAFRLYDKQVGFSVYNQDVDNIRNKTKNIALWE
ncbi:hypothetical protein KIN20_007229 [Parelaphostrongylus tenuis]|uniref:EF-hand domain-containing protein n=1 Tax=Parelaphostrongylus tenuis TaxID=148309 RepID=A0AAD5QHN2_PARTN|nr:hypothetical protein KIN20_007229 [Parelaphostrongylus tenuis]